eukprot:CAMPEP_0174250122 /NCGR_PEP_ID=MMETSP0439-20130205/392_1 /TAXON_ID=0 /ORGANISM="Stereomyxa ramosa, Strain Chinc5" /LENGTH=309 /DNA_ID=CAMNT_0015330113 /DNA_START=23 /DNA_END=952 /DNA_ORIENTATION=-
MGTSTSRSSGYKEKNFNNPFFYDPSLFPHLNPLIENQDVIAEELKSALSIDIINVNEQNGAKLSGVWCEDKAFDEFGEKYKKTKGWLHWWSVNNPDRPNADWTIFGLMQKGQLMTENCKLCPKTTEILKQVPGLRVVGFSRIQPDSGIDAHKGFTGRRYGSLAFHLGLVIPDRGAWLQCGPEIHHWEKKGDVLVFDDTFTHSAWNESSEERIILYVDFKIPDDVLPNLPDHQYGNSESESESDESSSLELSEGEHAVLGKFFDALQEVAAARKASKETEQAGDLQDTDEHQEQENKGSGLSETLDPSSQ